MQLLERTTGGLHVTVDYIEPANLLVLNCEFGDVQVACRLDHDKALDAFEHPCSYLCKAQVAALNLK